MAAIASLSDLVNRMTGGSNGTPENLWVYKNGNINGTAASVTLGRWNSMWLWDGIPGGGSAPGAGSIPTNATTGAIVQTDPGGGRTKYLVGGGGFTNVSGAFVLYDRLYHHSGFSGTTTTAQNATAAALTRNTGGVGNQIWVEIYTNIGATATTITASYTNQAGTSGRTTLSRSIGASTFLEASKAFQLPLAGGDTGVQSVQSVTLAATTGTAGNFGVTIARPLALVAQPVANCGVWQSFMDGMQMPAIDTGACLSLLWMAGTSGTTEMTASFAFVEA